MDYPCDTCKELVPVEEHHGNDRSDGTSSYLCCECYESQNQRVCEVIDIINSVRKDGGYWHFKPNDNTQRYDLITQTVQLDGSLWDSLTATITPAVYKAVINKRANNDKR